MAKILVVGGDKLYVSTEKAKNIEKLKKDNYPPNHLVDINGKRSVELGRIKDIIFEEVTEKDKAYQTMLDERTQRAMQIEAEWQEWRKKKAMLSPQEKTKWFMMGPLYLLWKARLNKGNITEEIVEKVIPRIMNFFEENPEEMWCPLEVYGNLIPREEPAIKGTGTFASFAEVIQGRQGKQSTLGYDKEISIEDINF